MFSVKDVANNLGISKQALYNQKQRLQEMGYMQKNTFGNWEITVDGFNYLKERRINYVKQNENNEEKSLENTTNIDVFSNLNNNSTVLNFFNTRLEEIKQNYENQLNEQKQQVEYFKNLYESEKSERIKINNQYHTYLLSTSEENTKKSWWKFWDK